MRRHKQRPFLYVLLIFSSLGLAQEPPALELKDPNVKAPTVISKVEPEYTNEARRKNISGNVLLSLVVDKDGIPKNIKVLSPLDPGLDQKAIESVSKWRFSPGMKNGVAVAVLAQVEVSFRLCSPECANPDLSRAEQARALVNIAVHDLRGDMSGKRNETAAFQNMEKAAALDYGPAETRLGEFYLDGIGTPKNPAKAAEMFDRATFHGDRDGQYSLGTLYKAGTGVPRDDAMAMKLFTQAAQKDQPEAEYALGLASETGDGAEQDVHRAFKWYQKGAEQGYGPCQLKLAKMYWTASLGKQDPVAALEWATVAEKGGWKAASADVQQYKAAMTPDRIAEAEKRAARSKARVPKAKP